MHYLEKFKLWCGQYEMALCEHHFFCLNNRMKKCYIHIKWVITVGLIKHCHTMKRLVWVWRRKSKWSHVVYDEMIQTKKLIIFSKFNRTEKASWIASEKLNRNCRWKMGGRQRMWEIEWEKGKSRKEGDKGGWRKRREHDWLYAKYNCLLSVF